MTTLHLVPRWLAGLLLLAAGILPAAASVLSERPPRAAVSDEPKPGVVRSPLDPRQQDGSPVSSLFLDLYGGTGEAERDRQLRAEIESRTRGLTAGPFNALLTEQALGAIRSLPGVRDVDYALYASDRPGEVVLVISATLAAAAPPAEREAPTTQPAAAWPVLIQNERTLLRFQLNGGLGTYLDVHPWFASPETYTSVSPIAKAPPDEDQAFWGEAWVEYGIAGATQIGTRDFYPYGEVTVLSSGSTGQDLFRDDTRSKTLLEKAYAGLLWAERGTKRSARVSAGRQNWQLDNGFLFSRYSGGANAGPNAALYLNPRTTYEMAMLAEAKFDRFKVEFFDVDPAELEDYDSGTRFQGAHVAWVDAQAWDLGLVALHVPASDSRIPVPQGGTVPREGLQTFNARAGHRAVAGIAGLNVLGEYARQRHEDVDWSASAWYAQAGYTAGEVPWRPSLTYRLASFSGDDPDTATREAFDPMLSGGLDEWVQGVNFKKVVGNSNLSSHRVRINLAPNLRLNYTLDYFHLWADEATAAGDRVYGDEVDLTVRWAISKRLFFLGVAGVAWPGEVVRAQTQNAAEPWSTVQASLFWGF